MSYKGGFRKGTGVEVVAHVFSDRGNAAVWGFHAHAHGPGVSAQGGAEIRALGAHRREPPEPPTSLPTEMEMETPRATSWSLHLQSHPHPGTAPGEGTGTGTAVATGQLTRGQRTGTNPAKLLVRCWDMRPQQTSTIKDARY